MFAYIIYCLLFMCVVLNFEIKCDCQTGDWKENISKKLLIIDVNGVMLRRWYNRPPQNIKLPLHKIGKHHVCLRPAGLSSFLDWMFKLFDVGVWSSMQEKNLAPLLELINEQLRVEGYEQARFKFTL